MSDIADLYSKVDQLIRTAQVVRARELLRSFRTDRRRIRNPRHFRMLAEMYRRVGWQPLAIKVLHPLVRSEAARKWAAEDADRAEYAANLTFVGATDEAIQILKTLDPKANPKVLLFQAFAHLAKWDASAAEPLLRQYVADGRLSEYDRRIGTVNLFASLVSTQDGRSEILEKGPGIIAGIEPQSLLWVNLNEILTQAAIWEKKWKLAESCLSLLASAPQMTGVSYQLFIEKWRLFYASWTEGMTSRRLRQFDNLIDLARNNYRWEVLRDTVFLKALVTNDLNLARDLYFGTPHAAFRKRIVANFPEFSIPRDGQWALALGGRRRRTDEKPFLDLTKTPDGLKTNQAPDRLLRILLSDIFRPQPLAQVASQLFPDQYYHPVHSLNRVNQILLRLREFLSQNQIPLQIQWKRGMLLWQVISFRESGTVSLPPQDEEPVSWSSKKGKTKSKTILVFDPDSKPNPWNRWLDRSESVSLEVLQVRRPNLSRRHLQRQLQNAIGNGWITAVGSTRNRRYRLSSS